jgi:hypothetical protein
MIDTYKMILWAEPKKETKEEQVQKIHDMLSVLIDFGEPFLPNYLPAKRKRDCKPFVLNYENIEKLLKKSKKYEELDERLGVGKTIGFFSSLNDDESSLISITIGNSGLVGNSITLKFPTNFDFNQANISDKLSNLFKELIKIFNPYWGCISGWFNCEQFGGYYDNNKGLPNAVFWINYWGENISNMLKVSKQVKKDRTHKFYEIEQYSNGYFLRLQEHPIDMNNKKQIHFQQEMNKIFKL